MGKRFRKCICSSNKAVPTNHVIARLSHCQPNFNYHFLFQHALFEKTFCSHRSLSCQATTIALVVCLSTTNANVQPFPLHPPFRSSPTDPTTTTVLPKLVLPPLLSQKLSRNHPMLTGKRFYMLFFTLRQQESAKIVMRLLKWRRLFWTKTEFKWKMRVLSNFQANKSHSTLCHCTYFHHQQ